MEKKNTYGFDLFEIERKIQYWKSMKELYFRLEKTRKAKEQLVEVNNKGSFQSNSKLISNNDIRDHRKDDEPYVRCNHFGCTVHAKYHGYCYEHRGHNGSRSK